MQPVSHIADRKSRSLANVPVLEILEIFQLHKPPIFFGQLADQQPELGDRLHTGDQLVRRFAQAVGYLGRLVVRLKRLAAAFA